MRLFKHAIRHTDTWTALQLIMVIKWLENHHPIKTCGGMEVQLHMSLKLAIRQRWVLHLRRHGRPFWLVKVKRGAPSTWTSATIGWVPEWGRIWQPRDRTVHPLPEAETGRSVRPDPCDQYNTERDVHPVVLPCTFVASSYIQSSKATVQYTHMTAPPTCFASSLDRHQFGLSAILKMTACD